MVVGCGFGSAVGSRSGTGDSELSANQRLSGTAVAHCLISLSYLCSSMLEPPVSTHGGRCGRNHQMTARPDTECVRPCQSAWAYEHSRWSVNCCCKWRHKETELYYTSSSVTVMQERTAWFTLNNRNCHSTCCSFQCCACSVKTTVITFLNLLIRMS